MILINKETKALGRVIQTQSVGAERNKLLRMIVISLRELIQQQEPNKTTKDCAAFIGLALAGVADTVERTVAPWEKRDYWVKADKFRMDWNWVDPMAKKMQQATLEEDWPSVAMLSAQLGTKLSNIEVSPRHRMGKPWVDAWSKLQKQAAEN